MQEHELPTWPDMFKSVLAELDAARSSLSGAVDWLRSDWRPLGTTLPDGVGSVRRDVIDRIGRMQEEIDQAEDALLSTLAPR